MTSWNGALTALSTPVTPSPRPLVLYADAFTASDLAVIPEAGLPPGLPAWMGSDEPWAGRQDATPKKSAPPSLCRPRKANDRSRTGVARTPDQGLGSLRVPAILLIRRAACAPGRAPAGGLVGAQRCRRHAAADGDAAEVATARRSPVLRVASLALSYTATKSRIQYVGCVGRGLRAAKS
jgi:hypothetical protein